MKYLIPALVSLLLALAYFSFPTPPGRGIASCGESGLQGYEQNILLEGQLLQGVQNEAFQKSAGEYRAFLMQLQADALANRAAIRQMYGLDSGAFRPEIYSAFAVPTIVPFNPQAPHSIFQAPQISSLNNGNQLFQSNQLF